MGADQVIRLSIGQRRRWRSGFGEVLFIGGNEDAVLKGLAERNTELRRGVLAAHLSTLSSTYHTEPFREGDWRQQTQQHVDCMRICLEAVHEEERQVDNH